MSLNKAIIMGRITHELELKQTQSGTAVLQFTVAVDRYTKDEEKQADFISCVAWRQTAEFISKYFGKGRMIAITGSLRTRTYDDKNGSKHYVTEINVEQADFTGEKSTQNAPQAAQSPQGYNYTTQAPNAAQSASQPPQNASYDGNSNGYPAQSMNAVPKNDSSAEYAAFNVYSGGVFGDTDGVPF